jgi:hypothetical protein
MATPKASGTPVPSLAEIDQFIVRNHLQLRIDFDDFAIKAKYPPRCWKTFAVLLAIAKNRASFATGIGKIMVYSRQSKSTIVRALRTLHDAGWIEMEHRFASNGYWWVESNYRIPRLEITE